MRFGERIRSSNSASYSAPPEAASLQFLPNYSPFRMFRAERPSQDDRLCRADVFLLDSLAQSMIIPDLSTIGSPASANGRQRLNTNG
jgi:hypothetical protein